MNESGHISSIRGALARERPRGLVRQALQAARFDDSAALGPSKES